MRVVPKVSSSPSRSSLLGDADAVDPGAVGRAEVDDHEPVAVGPDLGVAAADVRVGQDDGRTRAAGRCVTTCSPSDDPLAGRAARATRRRAALALAHPARRSGTRPVRIGSSSTPARPRPGPRNRSPRRGRARGRRRTAPGPACRAISANWSMVLVAERRTVKALGTMVRPRTSTERLSSISRTSRRPSSTGAGRCGRRGRTRPRPYAPSRRSNPCRPIGPQVYRLPPMRWAPGRRLSLPLPRSLGRVAELADAQDSGSCVRKDVGVQVPPRPLTCRCRVPVLMAVAAACRALDEAQRQAEPLLEGARRRAGGARASAPSATRRGGGDEEWRRCSETPPYALDAALAKVEILERDAAPHPSVRTNHVKP